MNGYNFTENVRAALAHAREESARLRHEYVGTEHILLGLLREDNIAVQVIDSFDVDPDALVNAVDSVVKKGASDHPTGPDLHYTSRAKKVLELSMAEARDLNHSYVGTEHL
ncbi:MAG TPA: Clp protease N-terminal domain-containing protein, partial [Gemmatimonadaceae bacterium]